MYIHDPYVSDDEIIAKYNESYTEFSMVFDVVLSRDTKGTQKHARPQIQTRYESRANTMPVTDFLIALDLSVP